MKEIRTCFSSFSCTKSDFIKLLRFPLSISSPQLLHSQASDSETGAQSKRFGRRGVGREDKVPAGPEDGGWPQGPTDAADGRQCLFPEQQQQKQNLLALREEPLAQVPRSDHHAGRQCRADTEKSDPQSRSVRKARVVPGFASSFRTHFTSLYRVNLMKRSK